MAHPMIVCPRVRTINNIVLRHITRQEHQFSSRKMMAATCYLDSKEIIIPEATLKIGYNSMKPKQLNVFDTNKTCTRSQFLCHTLSID